jgi:hypothetical protein
MRYVDGGGRIAWKATPRLCDHLRDLERDAQDDLDCCVSKGNRKRLRDSRNRDAISGYARAASTDTDAV